MSIKANKIVECVLNRPSEGLATLMVSLLNAFVLRDVGTEVVALQSYYSSIEDCVSHTQDSDASLQGDVNHGTIELAD